MADEDQKETGWVNGKFEFPLAAPIVTEDGSVSKITVREPTGADVMAVGNPVLFNPIADPPTITIKDKEMGAMIGRCADITPVFIGKLKPKDLINLGWILAPFFIPV